MHSRLPNRRLLSAMLLLASMSHASAEASEGVSEGDAASSAAGEDEARVNGERGQDIIVTAERRETNLLRTPGAITAVSDQDLREKRIESLNDLAASVPGLGTTGGAPQTSLFIRGIGTSDPGSPPSIGVYIDDVYNPRAFGNNLFDLPDVASVEVLRGPQGTLYGQNTSGGAVKVTSRRPNDKAEGRVLLEVGNYDSYRAQVYLSGPIVPGLLNASVAYTGRSREGYVYNATLDYWVEDAKSNQARLKLLFTPASNFEAALSYSVLSEKSDTQSVVPLNFGARDPYVTYSPRRFDPSRDVKTVSLNASWELNPALTLKSITAYRYLSNLNPNDTSGLPDDRSGFIQLLKNDQISQEFQALGETGSVHYILGAVYRNEKFSLDRNAWTNSAYTQIVSDQTVVDTALYGQANWEFADGLTLTGGLRYGWQTNDFSNSFYRTDARFNPTALVYSVADLEYDDEDFSYKLGLDYQFAPNWLAYASWTKGSKAGGFNRAASTAAIADIPVRPETVTTYEAGVKGRTADGLFQGSASLFYNDFQDYQATVTNPVIDGQIVVGNVVANAAQATTYGAEIEGSLFPVDGLEARFAAAYLHTRFDRFQNPTGAAATDYTGNALPFSPTWILSADLSYTLPLDIPGRVKVRPTLDYRSTAFSDIANRVATRLPEQLFVNLGISYATDDDRWTFQALARNLFDRTIPIGYRAVNPALGIDSTKFSAPRMVTFSAQYKF